MRAARASAAGLLSSQPASISTERSSRRTSRSARRCAAASRASRSSVFEGCEVGGLVGAFGFEGVEAAAEPVAEGPVAGVGGFEFGDEPVLTGGQVGDLSGRGEPDARYLRL